MRYKQLLESAKREVSAQEAAKLIVNKAYNFLKESDGRVLISGRRNPPSDAFVGHYRAKRMPLDSTYIFQEAIDEHLQQLGAKALRSNSMFVTLSKQAASGYGKAMYIFPLGQYHYHWIDGVGELIPDLIDETIGSQPEDVETLSLMTGIDKDKLQSFIDKNFDTEYVSLYDLVNSRLISVDKYEYIIIKEQILMYDFKIDTGLDDWIDYSEDHGHHELVINSSDGYLAVDPEFFVEHVLPLLPDGLIDINNL